MGLWGSNEKYTFRRRSAALLMRYSARQYNPDLAHDCSGSTFVSRFQPALALACSILLLSNSIPPALENSLRQCMCSLFVD